MQMNINPQDIRQHILEIAQQIIGCKGFVAVGINKILKVSRLLKGSFCYYFASKKVFGAAMLEDYFTHYLEKVNTS
ncbi:hypothetical protein C5469_04785 [Photorhabdus cinerea]|uniref:HTH tetR-type domain-containing protein n=2 Tax=Photorhabdus cinerea TaxID=471575 RepID=A0A7X5QC35_9GAMM|nr:hypothetical protein [Photorhabdus cinerea]